jgi:hypothetical protein
MAILCVCGTAHATPPQPPGAEQIAELLELSADDVEVEVKYPGDDVESANRMYWIATFEFIEPAAVTISVAAHPRSYVDRAFVELQQTLEGYRQVELNEDWVIHHVRFPVGEAFVTTVQSVSGEWHFSMIVSLDDAAHGKQLPFEIADVGIRLAMPLKQILKQDDADPQPPGVSAIPSAHQRAALAELVRTDPEAQRLWAPLQQRADQALMLSPRPLKELVYQGHLQTHPARITTVDHLQDMDHIDVLVQAWVITGDERYADHALEFAVAWARTYRPTGDPINENKLEPMLSAYALLNERLSAEQRDEFEGWTRQLARAQIDSIPRFPGTTTNNWHPKRLKLVAWAGRILDEPQYLDFAVSETKTYIAHALRPDGSSRDFEQRDSLGYHIGGVKPLLRLAAILAPSGEDLYHYTSPEGASPQRSVRFIEPYARGEKVHGEFARTESNLDRRRAEAGLERYRPGRPFRPQESVRLLEIAIAFEPEYGKLLSQVLGDDMTFGTWPAVLASIGWAYESIGK